MELFTMRFRDKRKSKSKDKKTLRAVKDADTTRANGDEPPNPAETRDTPLELVVCLSTDAQTADSVSDSPANNATFDDNETGEDAAVCDSAGGDGADGIADDTLDGARAADDSLGTGVADGGLQTWPASQPKSLEVEVVQHEDGVVQLGDLFLRR